MIDKKPFTMPFYALKTTKMLVQEHFGNNIISKWVSVILRTTWSGLIHKRCAKRKPGHLLIKIFHARYVTPHGIDTHDYGFY
jgi:hypothetical protein